MDFRLAVHLHVTIYPITAPKKTPSPGNIMQFVFPDAFFRLIFFCSVAFDSIGMFGALACKDSRKVLLISLDDYTPLKVLHRPRLPANDLCFSPNGQYVAIASAESEVHVAAVDDSNPTITLRQNGMGAIKSVSFDNNGTILATVSGSGYLELWKPFEGAESVASIHSAKISDSDPRETSPLLLRCCWTKSNNLVIPFFKDVRILDKDFKPKATLSGHHRDNVSQVVLGADGDLLASFSVDGVCCIWNVKTETLLTSISDVPKGSVMTWPSGSADILFVDRNGGLGKWKNAAKTPVSPDAAASSRAEASSAVKTVVKRKTSGKSSLMDLEAEVSGSASDDEKSGSDDVGDDDMKDFIDESTDSPKQKQGATKRKQSKRRLHSNVGLSDSDDVDDDFAPDAYPVFESKMQDPVQPCNCSSDAGIHSFFGYNHKAAVYGTLSGREEYNAETDIVVEFHDKVKNRPIRFKTPHNVVRGCLGEAGVLLAVNDPACVIFRGIPDQGRDSKWEISLQSTSVALAVGDSWSAVACVDRTLRIITSSGLVSALFCIPGDVVMLTARNSMLAVAYHAGEATLAGNQSIVVAVYDVFKRRQITAFPLALSSLAHLMWMAFNDSGSLFTFDSAGVFRVVSQDFGCAQVPMKLEADDKRVWPVDIEDEEIFYMALRPDQSCPTTDSQARPYLKTSQLVTEETQQAGKQSSAKQEQQIRLFADFEGKLIRGLALSRGVDTESDAYLRST
jgi:chromosome transmission fidelity protein 4